MNVLLIGSGAREHALGLALARSPGLVTLIACPGNPGLDAVAAERWIDPDPTTVRFDGSGHTFVVSLSAMTKEGHR